ncbi:hypothetical protein OS035_16340 [Rhizobium sp. 268]|uniref:hypothetical protein n=1 Tax=Rhizobium sp. 268 TaxID=2996375 RepID=UPI002F926A16
MSLSDHARNAASAVRARKRVRKEGFNMRGEKLWSEDEIEIVRHLAPDYDAICKLIPHRTRRAIRAQASVLGRAHKRHRWTGAEVALLRRLYPNASREKLCESFPGVSWRAICAVARYHGFRRARKPYVLTGVTPLDDIRAKCFEIHWTMADLDEAAGTKGYFARARWGRKTVNYKAIGRAIQSLDGVINIQWLE